MATASPPTRPLGDNAYTSDTDASDQARGGRRAKSNVALANTVPGPHPASSVSSQPAGQLLKGAVDANGNQKDAALLLGIKLDLEADIHLNARVRGDITIGLY